MHINYRRKNKFKSKAHGTRSFAWWMIYSSVPMRKDASRRLRRKSKLLIAMRKFTEASFLRKVNYILWNYW